MANQPSKESSLFPSSDGEREDSGLQDILSVAASIKDSSDDSLDDESEPEDSGMILFTAGGDDADSSSSDADDDALFANFSGSLGAGFGTGIEEPSTDATPATDLVTEASVTAAKPTEAKPAPAQQKRSFLPVIAVVLGLGVAGGAALYLSQDRGQDPQDQAQVATVDDAAVGKAEEPTAEELAAAASGGQAVEPEPEPEAELEAEEAGLLADTEGLGAAEMGDEDPLAMKDGLLESDGTNGVKKAGKWDQGTSYQKPAAGTNPVPKPKSNPEPDIEPDPLAPKPKANTGANEEVDCLLNPDLPKCQTGGSTAPKEREVLAPKLPDKLSSSQLRSGMNGIKGDAKKCGLQNGVPPGTKVQVHVSIEGATGKVKSVQAKAEHAGTPLGGCVEKAVESAQFELFKKDVMGFDYPLIM